MTNSPRYENIRAAYIAWVMLMNTGVVWFGLDGLAELNATSSTFLLTLLALLNIPVSFFFHDRWMKGTIYTLEREKKVLLDVVEGQRSKMERLREERR